MTHIDLENIEGNIAIFSDIHFGKSKDSLIKLRTSANYMEWFMEQCEKQDVKLVIFGGDWFDNRISINVSTLNVAYEYLKKLAEKYPLIIIVGNHDTTLKRTNKINSLAPFNQIANIKVVDELTVLNNKILLAPWNVDIKNIKEQFEFVVGHFEFNGAMTPGLCTINSPYNISDLAVLSPLIFSGHYHIHKIYPYGDSTLITVGNTFEQDWGDYENEKGFYIYNTTTHIYNFVKNTISPIHIKYYWSRLKSGSQKLLETEIKGNYIKLIVDEKFTYDEVMKLSNEINQLAPLRNCELDFIFSISNELNKMDFSSDGEDIKMTKFEYIKKFITKLDEKLFDDINKDKLTEMAQQYYEQSTIKPNE